MSYCINPLCVHRQNPDDIENCLSCGTSLVINGRIHLIKPIKALTDNPYDYFEVFEVDDRQQRRVMKVLKWNSPKLRSFIEQEFMSLRLIQHPNIPHVESDDFFTFTPNNSPLELRCLVMDKIDGENLDECIKNNGKISQSLALNWLRQLVDILDLVHHTEFFHRDIKPSNIILQPNGQLALVDFGAVRRLTNTYMAKISASGGTSTRVGNYEITSIVTPRYSPIEQIEGQAVPQSDFFALGRTFVYLLTAIQLNKLPKDEKTGKLIWRNKAPQIDKPFADFIDELMAPLPGQRPQTTRVILQRLERIPLQSKINRVVKSKAFGIGVIIVGVLSIFGLYWVSHPAIAEYLLNEGRKAQKENRFYEARNKFNQAINIKPDIAKLVSDFYVEQGFRRDVSPEQARKYYELAIKYNTENDTAYNNLALVCQQLQDIRCVNNSYAAVFKLKPNKWESHYGLGNFYDDLGKYNLAEKQYKLAIESSELALDAVSNLARIKNLQGEYTVAILTAEQGLQKAKDPELKAALYKTIGWAKLEQKRYSESKIYLEKAKELDTQRIDAYCLLAQAQEALGQINDARISWEVCLIAESSLPEVQRWRLQILKRLLGDVVPKSSP
ncbi:MAG: protein kinase [Mojavia pulchra JT2-VF2]|uniref:non-specific serine/threonine protein kinase n=1 Tax=Mojavia pulchra JT2-VF2 TaxID=287848 RepID=A0A951Q943_9NOST|nr:protein kinase [Mojavia pulchra JT2-VF2]